MKQNISPSRLCLSLKDKKLPRRAVSILLGAITGLALGAEAQVSNINSVVVTPRILFGNSLSNAVLEAVTNYPTVISFTETNAGTSQSGFQPIQDLWEFSADGGKTAYLFQTNDYFTAYMNVTLTGVPAAPRKEAGFAFEDINGNINGQYILDTDAGEVVAFGGNLPFYASPLDHTFVSGETITMGVSIFKDSNGSNAIVYAANGISSPVLEFGNPGGVNAVYTVNNSPAPYALGGYFQTQGQGTGVTNMGAASFQNIHIFTQPPLSIAESGNQTLLYWPASQAYFLLQASTNLSSTNWAAVTNGNYFIGVAVTNSNPSSFYRLIAPQ
jgi:hypothetical protein